MDQGIVNGEKTATSNDLDNHLQCLAACSNSKLHACRYIHQPLNLVVEKQLTYDEIGVSFALLLWKSVIEIYNEDLQQRQGCKSVLPNKLIFALALLSLSFLSVSKRPSKM